MVVTGGGGGIPVGRRGTVWDGVDAVIDKDYAAAELARQLSADALVLITGVEAVLLDYGQPSERRVTYLDAAEAERHLADGQFPEGSMGPKVRAATRFVRHGGGLAVITTAPLVERTLAQRRSCRSVGGYPDCADGRPGRSYRVTVAISRYPDTYVDSVVQLRCIRAMREVDGVDWASAAMATPANVETLLGEGVSADDLAAAGANDLVLVVRASSRQIADEALRAGSAAFSAEVTAAADDPAAVHRAPRSVPDALRLAPDANVAVVSVPGDYAALAAYQALSNGRHVLLFSDNVPVAKEVGLKRYAASRGLLLMGPGAGTAVLSGRRPRFRERRQAGPGRRGGGRGDGCPGGDGAAGPVGSRG